MSYEMSFKGSFQFADEHCLEAGIDALVEYHDDREGSVVDLDDLVVDGLKVSVSWRGSAPASMSFGTSTALRLLGEHARSGSVRAKFEGDPAELIRAGGRRTASGLPPRHHRWQVYAAAKAGSAEQLRALIAQGISVVADFKIKHWSQTSLHLAAESGNVDAVKVLLEAGASPDARASDNGATPLGVAKTKEIALLLLGAGANVNALSNKKHPIELACDHRNVDVALALLEAGSELPTTKSAMVEMLADIARASGLALLRKLAERGTAVRTALAHPDVMTAAVSKGDPVVVDLLLEHGAKLPKTFVADAVSAGAVELLRTALKSSDAVSGCGLSSKTQDAMCVAARDGKPEVMEILVQHGVPLMPVKPGETTPLHSAAGWTERSVPAVSWLLKQGVSVDSRTAEGLTALAHACSNSGPKEAIALLLEHGADPDAVPKEDRAKLRARAKKKPEPVVKKKPSR